MRHWNICNLPRIILTSNPAIHDVGFHYIHHDEIVVDYKDVLFWGIDSVFALWPFHVLRDVFFSI